MVSDRDSSDIKPDVFPHDRVALFSDAIFAIAITLLVIEIKIPTHAQVNAMGLIGALTAMTPLFIGYLVSFLVISLFWVGHMKTWKHVTSATSGMVWLNIFELLFVALMPFTTGLYTENFGSNLAFSLYCLNLVAIAAFSYWLRSVVIRREGLVQKLGAHEVAWLRAQTMIAMVVFVACMLLASVTPWLARYGFIAIFVLHIIMKRYLNRRERLRLAAQSG
jgi:uncharacterized membrane protein